MNENRQSGSGIAEDIFTKVLMDLVSGKKLVRKFDGISKILPQNVSENGGSTKEDNIGVVSYK